MEAKTKKILFYVAVALIIAAAAIFGIVEIAGGVDEAPVVADSAVVEVVDTVAVDSLPVAALVADSVVVE